MKVLIIGGTGTLGNEVLPILLQDPAISRIRVLSRGEHKQMHMAYRYRNERVDWLLGDVRDYERVRWASEGIDSIFLFAAVKSVDKAEYDQDECMSIIYTGAVNTIVAARNNKVYRVIFTSTDKACEPFNFYGACKYAAERRIIGGNIGDHNTIFSACRYGNVLGSNGSVVAKGFQEITDPDMTRFFMSAEEAANFVVTCHDRMRGGETFIPKLKSISIGELASIYNPNKKPKIIGRRPGEKRHEKLFSCDEVDNGLVTDLGWCFVRWPSHQLFPFRKDGEVVTEPYSSERAARLTGEEVKRMLCQKSQFALTQVPLTVDGWNTLLSRSV